MIVLALVLLALVAIGESIAILRLFAIVNEHEELIAQARPSGCSHPDVINVGTFGHPAYECVLCHASVDR